MSCSAAQSMSCSAAHSTARLYRLTDMLVLLLQVTDEQLDEVVSHFVAAAQAAQQACGGGGDSAHLTLAGFLAASEQSQVSICPTATADLLVAPVWRLRLQRRTSKPAAGGLHTSSATWLH